MTINMRHFSKLTGKSLIVLVSFIAGLFLSAHRTWAVEAFCPGGSSPNPNVIWCDDFDDSVPVSQKYFEYDNAGGSFVPAPGQGFGGSVGMQATWQPGQVNAGHLTRTFGRNPVNSQGNSNSDFNEIYWRLYLKEQPGWTGNSYKLTRATSIVNSAWAQSMIAHVWGDGVGDNLLIDPASGINSSGNLVTTKYNDFANLRWLGLVRGTTPIFNPFQSGTWHCIEAHVKLNTSGTSNGIFEFWIDGNLNASRTDLNWIGTWSGYGINTVLFENYWNSGALAKQSRTMDNIVISTQKIGCLSSSVVPNPPASLKVQ